jgi:hypothetical protein
MKGKNDFIIKSVTPEQPDGSYTVIWDYEGRDVPIEVIGPPPEEENHFLEQIADFLWEYRHLGRKSGGPQ